MSPLHYDPGKIMEGKKVATRKIFESLDIYGFDCLRKAGEQCCNFYFQFSRVASLNGLVIKAFHLYNIKSGHLIFRT